MGQEEKSGNTLQTSYSVTSAGSGPHAAARAATVRAEGKGTWTWQRVAAASKLSWEPAHPGTQCFLVFSLFVDYFCCFVLNHSHIVM